MISWSITRAEGDTLVKPVGQIFRLKLSTEELKQELVPSFWDVIRGYLGEPVRSRFKDSSYVIEATFPTKSLEFFVKDVVKGLRTPVAQGFFLIEGFGFGKTHAIILLWHLLNSREGASSRLASSLEIDEDLAERTLVIGIDFSAEKHFIEQVVGQLRAISSRRDPWSFKDPRLSSAVSEALRETSGSVATSEGLSDLVASALTKYRSFKGEPRLLLLVDELGYGIVNRLRKYAESRKEESYTEITSMLSFIDQLYAKLDKERIPAVFIIAYAEQDKEAIEAIRKQHIDNETMRLKIEGIQSDLYVLEQRLPRAGGGLPVPRLSYDPAQAAIIAKHRVLSGRDEEAVKRELLEYIEFQARQLNLENAFKDYESVIKNYYPLSPGMSWLLRKILERSEIPGTEYVRTAIFLVAKAAEEALRSEPEKALTVGLKHLSLGHIALPELMGALRDVWSDVLRDFEQAIKAIEPQLKPVAEFLAKQLLAKGATANVFGLLEARELRELKRYGIELSDSLIDMLATMEPGEFAKVGELLERALSELKSRSMRIEEREVADRRFYLPTLARTVYDRLASFIAREREELSEPARLLDYLSKHAASFGFINPKAFTCHSFEDVMVVLKDITIVKDSASIVRSQEVNSAQSEGRVALILVPPWDFHLFTGLSRMKYEDMVRDVAEGLNTIQQDIRRPYHLLILLPNLEDGKLRRLAEKVAYYEAYREFLNYLNTRMKEVVEKKVEEYENVIKRLPEYTEESVKKARSALRGFFEQQLHEASSLARKEIVRLSREVFSELLGLYEQIIYYDPQEGRFISKKVSDELFRQADQEIEKAGEHEDISKYSNIVNWFLGKAVERVGYTCSPTELKSVILEKYREEARKIGDILPERRLSEEVNNAMLYYFNVKPLSSRLVRDAMRKLDGAILLETDDKRIMVSVDEGNDKVKFIIEMKKIPQLVDQEKPSWIERSGPLIQAGIQPAPPQQPLISLVKEALIIWRERLNYDELKQRLTGLYQVYATQMSVVLSASGGGLEATLRFSGAGQHIDTVISALRFLEQLSAKYNAGLEIVLKFEEEVPEDKLKEILGPFYGRRGVYRTFDKFLQT